MYLFDTDCISNLIKKQPSEKLIHKISSLNKSDQYISTITIGELIYGALKSTRPGYYLDYLNNKLLIEVNILDFDIHAAFIYGKIRTDLVNKGRIISNADMQIAATAVSNDLILITGNIKHFESINELQIENWLE